MKQALCRARVGLHDEERMVLLPLGHPVPVDGRHPRAARQAYIAGRPDYPAGKGKQEIPPRHHARRHPLAQSELETGLLLHRTRSGNPHRARGHRLREEYLYASGDIERDMREIKLYFKPFKGKHPERFDLGENV